MLKADPGSAPPSQLLLEAEDNLQIKEKKEKLERNVNATKSKPVNTEKTKWRPREFN